MVILEKGPYVPPSQITNLECQAFDAMYEKHSLLTSRDGNVMILAGSTLGGGTTINWACCLPTPNHVTSEWAAIHDLPHFCEQDYCDSMQAVQERLGCLDTNKVTHNAANTRMKQGCHVLGYSCDTTGQNLRDTQEASAGYTCFGDRERNKQSGLVTYLADAATSGARIIDNCKVHRVLCETDERRRAVGVVGYVGENSLQVNAARCVIVAAGSLHTPCLLLRSGFRNKHIGRHLHLHPVVATVGMSSDEIHAYLGAPMTTVCNTFQLGITNNGYGAKLECPCGHTGLMAAALAYRNARDFQDKMSRLKFGVPLIVLQRDTSEGRVRLGSDGFSPVIDYVLNKADQANMRDSLKGAIRILLASGSREVFTGHMNDPGLHLSDEDVIVTSADIENNDKIQEYLRSIDERGMETHKIGIFSAHQMSSCRMSASPDSGVVDENGETWECDDLFVMDASAFPTASGANPMLTTLALSHMLSTRLALRLKAEDHEKGKNGVAEASERRKERNRKRGSQKSVTVDVSGLRLTTGMAAAVVISIVIARYLRA